MRFTLIDRITDLVPGKRIEALKNLTLAEEYLAEHFQGFPVLPGVLMLEAATQAGAWLTRITEDFRTPIVVLKEARAVKYGRFMTPGRQLKISCEMVGSDENEILLKVKGELTEGQSVSCKMTLERVRLADRNPLLADQEERLRRHLRQRFQLLATVELREKLRLG